MDKIYYDYLICNGDANSILKHGGLEYTDEFNNQSHGFNCTIYIARKK